MVLCISNPKAMKGSKSTKLSAAIILAKTQTYYSSCKTRRTQHMDSRFDRELQDEIFDASLKIIRNQIDAPVENDKTRFSVENDKTRFSVHAEADTRGCKGAFWLLHSPNSISFPNGFDAHHSVTLKQPPDQVEKYPLGKSHEYTCVLKVNLGCCQACVVNLKKLLSTIDGVYGFDINVAKGLVTVSGTAHPQLLVEKIRQKKKKAVLVSYEKPTPNGKTDDSNGKENKKNGDFLDSDTKENKKNGNFLDSNTKENKKHGNGDQKGKKKDYLCHHEPDPHEFEAYVAPKPSPIDTCRDPYCKIHHKKPVIIRPTDNTPTVKFQLPLNRPQFLPPHLPPPRFLPRPPPVPHYPRIEPIAYDRPLPQYDPWYHQRPPPQSEPWSYQRPPPPLPPHYGYHGARHAYTGH